LFTLAKQPENKMLFKEGNGSMRLTQMVSIGQGALSPWLKSGETLCLHHVDAEPQENIWHIVYSLSTNGETTYYHIIMDQRGDIHRLTSETQP
jgi:hypothetical protein